MLTANSYSIWSDYFSIAGLGVQEVPIVSCRPAAKQCLLDHGINTTLFGLGVGNATVVNEIAKYYD
jgi:hypothetical protein